MPCRSTAALFLAIATAKGTTAQILVRDIAPPTALRSSSPNSLVDLNGLVVFSARSEFGQEIWRSDGTETGTFMLRDIFPGTGSSNPRDLSVTNGSVVFVATVDGLGPELWRTDGTELGTFLLADLQPGPGQGFVDDPILFQGEVYFSSSSPGVGSELWRTNGTIAGTQLAVDIRTGVSGSDPGPFAVFGSTLAFGALDSAGRELWLSDGTPTGTARVTDLPGNPSVVVRGVVGGRIVFTADDGIAGVELWQSNGTAAGTSMLANIGPGALDGMLDDFVVVEDSGPSGTEEWMFFTADDGTHGVEVWATDGDPAGTTAMLSDIRAGVDGSEPAELTAAAGHVFFSADDGTSGAELWASNGPNGSTFLLYEGVAGANGSMPRELAPAFDGIAFVANDGGGTVGREPYLTTPVIGTTVRIEDVAPGATSSQASEFAQIGSDELFYSASDGSSGAELWRFDRTTGSNDLVLDLWTAQGDSDPDDLTEFGDALFFSASDGSTRELWSSDGSPGGTDIAVDLNGIGSGSPRDMVAWNGALWFTASDTGTGREIFSSDGTQSGTSILVDLRPGTFGSSPELLTPFGDLMLFRANDGVTGDEPYATDGTAIGTVRLADVRPGSSSSTPSRFTDLGTGLAVFVASDGIVGPELWGTDGTPSGTQLIGDINPGSGLSFIDDIVVLDGVAYFSASAPGVGNELWRSDGTPTGTFLVGDLRPGGSSTSPQGLTVAGDRLFFFGAASGTGRELFVSDGTLVGTTLVADLAPGPVGVVGRQMVALGDDVVFVIDDGSHGDEAWFSDGTQAGTFLLADLGPGEVDGVLESTLTAIPSTNLVAFAGTRLDNGLQVFVTDGTPTGTVQAGTIGDRPGIGAAEIDRFASVGSRIYFRGDDGITGAELWALDLSGAQVAFTENYGEGCDGATGLTPSIGADSSPSLGNTGFEITLQSTPPASPAVLFVGFAPNSIALGNGCDLLLQAPILTLPSVVTDTAGAASSGLAISTDPVLIGFQLFCQWFVVENGGPALGIATVSDGLRVVVGS